MHRLSASLLVGVLLVGYLCWPGGYAAAHAPPVTFLLSAVCADTQLSEQQVYLRRTSPTKWPQELPRNQGKGTLLAALDWLEQSSDCRGAAWLAGARQVVAQPHATTLAEHAATPVADRDWAMEQAVRTRHCLDILLIATDLADDGTDEAQQRQLALHLYLAGSAPLLEFRSQVADAALANLQTLLASSDSATWPRDYVPAAIERFDAHLNHLLSDKQLDASDIDSQLALRRIAAAHALTKRWIVDVLYRPEKELDLHALNALIERLDKLANSPALARHGEKVAAQQIAHEAGYIRDNLPAFRRQTELRRDVTPVILTFVQAIADNDRAQLKTVSLPSQVEAFGDAPSMLAVITNNEMAADIEIASIHEVQQLDPGRARAEVRTIITESSGHAYPSGMTLLLTLTDDGWRVGEHDDQSPDP